MNKYLEKIAMTLSQKGVAAVAFEKLKGYPASFHSKLLQAHREATGLAKSVQGMGKSISDLKDPKVLQHVGTMHPGIRRGVFSPNETAAIALKAQDRANKSGLGLATDQMKAESVAARLARIRSKQQ